MAQRERDKKEGDPWYVKADHAIIAWSIRQYHCSFRFIGIETARKTNLPKQNFKQFPNTCFKF